VVWLLVSLQDVAVRRILASVAIGDQLQITGVVPHCPSWNAPLGVRSAKRRHQSPEWTILSHVNASFKDRLLDLVLLDSLHPHSMGASWWSPPVLRGAAVKIFLASVSSVIHTMWLNREKRRAWTIAERCGCPVVRLSSSFRTWWYHLIPNSFRKHHWPRAPILSLLVTAENSSHTGRWLGCTYCTASAWMKLRLRFLTSRSDCLDSA